MICDDLEPLDAIQEELALLHGPHYGGELQLQSGVVPFCLRQGSGAALYHISACAFMLQQYEA